MAPKKYQKNTEKPQQTYLTEWQQDAIQTGLADTISGRLLSDEQKKKLEPLAESFSFIPAWKKEGQEKGGAPEKR